MKCVLQKLDKTVLQQKFKQFFTGWTVRTWLINVMVSLLSLSLIYWGKMMPISPVPQRVWNLVLMFILLLGTAKLGQNYAQNDGKVDSSGQYTWTGILTIWLKNWLTQIIICIICILTSIMFIYQVSDALFPTARNVTYALSGVLAGNALIVTFKKIKNRDIQAVILLLAAMLFFLPVPLSENPAVFMAGYLVGYLDQVRMVQLGIKNNLERLWGSSIIAVSLLAIVLTNSHGFNYYLVLSVTFVSAMLFLSVLRLLDLNPTLIIVLLGMSQSSALFETWNNVIGTYDVTTIAKNLPWLIFIMVFLGLAWTRLIENKVMWPTWGLKQYWKLFKQLWPVVLAGIGSYVIALVMQVDTLGLSWDNFDHVWAHGNSQVIVTGLILWSLMLILWRLFHHYWVGISLVAALSMIIMFTDKAKIKSRNEPILPSDLAMTDEALNLSKMVDNKYWVWLIVGLIVLVVAVILVSIFIKVPWNEVWQGYKKLKWALLLVGPLIVASSWFWNTSYGGQVTGAFDNEPLFFSQLSGANHNGPIVQFLNNLHVELAYEPTGYSKAEVERIERKYSKVADQINKTRTNNFNDQTVIYNLSESFANPNRVPGVKLTHDPMPRIHRIQKNSTSGLMMSSGYGGGTANMEWQALTGMDMGDFAATLTIAYTQMLPRMHTVDSIAHASDFMTTVHPYIGMFYSRIGDYKKLCIKRFYYQGNKKYPIKDESRMQDSPYDDDQTAYRNAMDRLRARKSGQTINLITMQNHMPYDKDWYTHKNERVKPSQTSGIVNSDNLWEYSTGVANTDVAVNEFIKQINKIHRPITIVWYGDHLPGLYNLPMDQDNNNVVLHQTDYFIYSNKYAREHGAKNLTNQRHKVVGTNDFIAMSYAQTNSKVGWYQALLTKVWEDLPAMAANNVNVQEDSHTRNMYVNENSQMVDGKKLSKNQKELHHDYRIIEYDMTLGHHYAKDAFVKTGK